MQETGKLGMIRKRIAPNQRMLKKYYLPSGGLKTQTKINTEKLRRLSMPRLPKSRRLK